MSDAFDQGIAERMRTSLAVSTLDASLRRDAAAVTTYAAAALFSLVGLVAGQYMQESDSQAVITGTASLLAVLGYAVSEAYRSGGADLRAQYERVVFGLAVLDELAPLPRSKVRLRSRTEIPSARLSDLSSWFSASSVLEAQRHSFLVGAWSRRAWGAFVGLIVLFALWAWWPTVVYAYAAGLAQLVVTVTFGVAAASVLARPAWMSIRYAHRRIALLRESEIAEKRVQGNEKLLELVTQLRSEASRSSRVVVPSVFYTLVVKHLASRAWSRYQRREGG